MNNFPNDKSSLLRRCILLLVLPAVLLISVSCGGKTVSETTTTTESSTEVQTPPPSVTLAAKDKSGCTIVFARGGDGIDRALELVKERLYKDALDILTGIEEEKEGYSYNAYFTFCLYTDIETCFKQLYDFESAYRYSSKRISLLESFDS